MILDKIGQPIVPGSVLAYASSEADDCPLLEVGKVVAIGFHEKMSGRFPIIHMKSFDMAHMWTDTTYPDRCVVLNYDTLPPAYRAILDTIEVVDA